MELAVPIFALGAMYILSNQKEKKCSSQELTKTLSNLVGHENIKHMGNNIEGMTIRENFSGINNLSSNNDHFFSEKFPQGFQNEEIQDFYFVKKVTFFSNGFVFFFFEKFQQGFQNEEIQDFY